MLPTVLNLRGYHGRVPRTKCVYSWAEADGKHVHCTDRGARAGYADVAPLLEGPAYNKINIRYSACLNLNPLCLAPSILMGFPLLIPSALG